MECCNTPAEEEKPCGSRRSAVRKNEANAESVADPVVDRVVNRAVDCADTRAEQRAGRKTNMADSGASFRAGEFNRSLSASAASQFEFLATCFRCDANSVLVSEGEVAARVVFLLEGRVKLSMNSIGGKRLILGIAEPGDILGLAAAISGCPCEIRAEAQFPCRLASMPRQSFLDFLALYPGAWQSVGRQLCLEHKRACDQLRNLGLAFTASTRLARLLLEWCVDGRPAGRGIRIQCSLTHEEIGECIGVARETVSRAFTAFRIRELVRQRGSTLVISSLPALKAYAGRAES